MSGIPRIIEVPVAFGGLIILAPVLVFCAILIKITSVGPVLFRQKRVGLRGEEFTLYKFRTMRAESSGPLVTASSDQRITSIGRMLRFTKLDELPELWNIIKGEMSFVGPRPEVPPLVNLASFTWQEILSVRPGITDPVTLRFRNEEALLNQNENPERFYQEVVQPYKMKGYAKFIKEKGFLSDLKIILQTIKVVLFPNSVPPPTIDELRKGLAEDL
jgi:lipopolysaccharide/colanic/teichoic acid biosynthesis glycosyltransferase